MYTPNLWWSREFLKDILMVEGLKLPFSYLSASKFILNDVLEWSEFLTDYHKINPHFKDKIVSGEVHMRKPDKEIFKYTLERLGCDAEQRVFVDNSVSNLLVAEELEIQTILFNRDGVGYEGE